MIDSPEGKRKFEVIYEKYRYLMMKVAMDVLKDFSLAEDAVQEAFLKVARNMRNIRGVDSLETKQYLTIITRNAAIDIYRSRARQGKREVPLDIDGMAGEGECPVTYLETELESGMLDILRTLPATYRDVLSLKYTNHMSDAEISRALGISKSAVRQRIARGKERIREEMGKRGKDHEAG